MVSFQRKKISRTASLGDVLKAAREQENLTIEKAARTLGIANKYVKSLEKGDYAALPGEVYAKNFLKKYAELLRLNVQPLLDRYEGEKPNLTSLHRSRHPFSSLLWSAPHLLRRALALTAVAILLIYLGLGVGGIFAPPPLNLENPPEGLVNPESRLLVNGQTLPETNVQINGRAVTSDSRGLFEEQINLQPGLNIITVTAVKKYGKSTTVTRNVIFNHEKR